MAFSEGLKNSFIAAQKLLFTLFCLGQVVAILWGIIEEGQQTGILLSQFFNFFILAYLPIAVLICVIYILILKVPKVQLYLYYYVWIYLLFGTLKRWSQNQKPTVKSRSANWIISKFFNDFYDSHVLRSFKMPDLPSGYAEAMQIISFKKVKKKFYDKILNIGRPVFVRREHLTEIKFWYNWAFTSVLLFNPILIQKQTDQHNEKAFTLKVNLMNQSYGIYNNAGKHYLREAYQNKEFNDECLKISEDIHQFLGNDNRTKCEINSLESLKIPFRWASGGVIPIANYKNRKWFVLFFRDIPPVGWNIANGASGSKEEYKDLHKLIYREFLEEVIILNREPKWGTKLPIKQKIVIFPGELPPEVRDSVLNRRFLKKHSDLRKQHDGLDLEQIDSPEIKTLSTPFEAEITYHAPNLKDVETFRIQNIIFSINPTEFGIEISRPVCFELKDSDYLLDGEIWEVEFALIRQPIILLSVEWLKTLYQKNSGSIGQVINEQPYLGCKVLNEVPFNEFQLFDKDIEFRRKRIAILEEDNILKKSMEAVRIRRWIDTYDTFFKHIKSGSIDIKKIDENQINPLLMLCPVTWKNIELMFKYKIL
ncbi:MAG: hypothetical protein LUQ04_01200 [Methanoregula sp.]|nr:hypothetical protein [Methanoregula sp.]